MLRYPRNGARETAARPHEPAHRAHNTTPNANHNMIHVQVRLSPRSEEGISLHRRKYFISSNTITVTITVIGQSYMLAACTGRLFSHCALQNGKEEAGKRVACR